MYNFDSINHNYLKLNGQLSTYQNIIDPVFDLPLACLENSEGFKIDEDYIYMIFNDEQYIYDVMRMFVDVIDNDNYNNSPINFIEDKCIIKLYFTNGRVPTFLTTSVDKKCNKCFLNADELKEFLSEGLGFKLQIKICNHGKQFTLDSVQILDILDGQQDYLTGQTISDPNLDNLYSDSDSDNDLNLNDLYK
jgi:hypothetical protein